MTIDQLRDGVVAMPVLLGVGAGAVICTAAALSSRAVGRFDLPAERWQRPLPARVATLLDGRAVTVSLHVTGLVVVAALITHWAASGRIARGGVVMAGVIALSLLLGPLVCRCNPARLVHRRDADAAATPCDTAPLPGGTAVPAIAWLAGLGALVLATRDGAALAVCLGGYLVAQAAAAHRYGPAWHHRGDALEVLASTIAVMAPIGRDAAGRLAVRNPVVSTAHAPLPATILWLGAVVVATALGRTVLTPDAGTTGAALVASVFGAAAVLAVLVLAVGLLLRVTIIRPFFVPAVVPLTAAHGVLAAGRWLPPVDLAVFVILHSVAIAVLHRQAVARHDLRTARAVQLPPRLAVLVSVLGGLVLYGGT